MTLHIGIFGTGRLGRLIAAAAGQQDDLEMSWSVGRQASLGDLPRVDVAIDVSHADAVTDHVVWADERRCPLVLGVTGWNPAVLPQQSSSGILIAPNFSLSLALMRRLTEVLGRYSTRAAAPVDLTVFDRHHRAKVDAPSGTARLLSQTLAAAADVDETSVQVSSQRIGAVVGYHEVRYTDGAETLTLTHEAHTRAVFADGALLAARWIHGRTGVHTFDEVADDLLSPMFTIPIPA